MARSCGSLLRMSLAYTDINQLLGKTFKYITANTSIKHSYRALGTPANGTGSAATGRASANRSSTIPWLMKQPMKTLYFSVKYTDLYRRQSSKYLSCFHIQSLLWISRIAFQSAVGLLPSVRPLRRDTTATSQAHLQVRMAGNSANLDSVS